MTKIWNCKIGEVEGLPPGADLPMREAVAAAYRKITGREPDFIFSGWGGELTEPERAVVEDRLPAVEAVEARERTLRKAATDGWPAFLDMTLNWIDALDKDTREVVVEYTRPYFKRILAHIDKASALAATAPEASDGLTDAQREAGKAEAE